MVHRSRTRFKKKKPLEISPYSFQVLTEVSTTRKCVESLNWARIKRRAATCNSCRLLIHYRVKTKCIIIFYYFLWGPSSRILLISKLPLFPLFALGLLATETNFVDLVHIDNEPIMNANGIDNNNFCNNFFCKQNSWRYMITYVKSTRRVSK